MRTLLLVAACAVTGAAWASANDQGPVVKLHSLEVKERIQSLELINVTARKPVSRHADRPDAELQAILDDVKTLETPESR